MGDTCTVPCYSRKACLTSCAYPIYRWTYAAASLASRSVIIIIRPGAMNSHSEIVPRSIFFFPHLSLYTKQQIQDSWLEIHLDLLHILHIFTVFTHFFLNGCIFSALETVVRSCKVGEVGCYCRSRPPTQWCSLLGHRHGMRFNKAVRVYMESST